MSSGATLQISQLADDMAGWQPRAEAPVDKGWDSMTRQWPMRHQASAANPAVIKTNQGGRLAKRNGGSDTYQVQFKVDTRWVGETWQREGPNLGNSPRKEEVE